MIAAFMARMRAKLRSFLDDTSECQYCDDSLEDLSGDPCPYCAPHNDRQASSQ